MRMISFHLQIKSSAADEKTDDVHVLLANNVLGIYT